MSLSQKDAQIIMGMLARGDHNHHIAAWFGENPARVAEVKDGSAFGTVTAAPSTDLPLKGAPGPKGRCLYAYATDALKVLKDKGPAGVAEAISELEAGIKRFDAHEA